MLRAAVEHAAAVVAKGAPDTETMFLRGVARSALESGVSDPAQLEQVIRSVYVDAFAAGGYGAAQQVGGAAVTLHGVADVDWSAWKPGSPLAAALTRNGGLQTMLDRAGITIKSVLSVNMDRLANAIADGVRSGSSVDAVAASLDPIVTARAEMIAHTETARAMTQATVDTYQANGVTEFDVVNADDPCPECEDAAREGPYPSSGDPVVPLHPLCRCAASPRTVAETGTSSGGLAGGDLAAAAAAFTDEEGTAAAADAVVEDAAGETLVSDAATALPDDLTGLSDDDLSSALQSAADDPTLDRIIAELDRRDAEEKAAQQAEAKRAAAAARRSAAAEAKQAELDEQLDEAINAGEDPISAYARIYGKDEQKVRVQEAMSALRAQGYTGRNFEELCRDQFKEYAERSWLEAENGTRGALLNKAGRAASINPRSLFVGQEARARKYASEELLGWWQENGRLTLQDFMDANLQGKTSASSRGYFL